MSDLLKKAAVFETLALRSYAQEAFQGSPKGSPNSVMPHPTLSKSVPVDPQHLAPQSPNKGKALDVNEDAADKNKSEQLRKLINSFLDRSRANIVVDNTPDIRWRAVGDAVRDGSGPVTVSLMWKRKSAEKSPFDTAALNHMLNSAQFHKFCSDATHSKTLGPVLEKMNFVFVKGQFDLEPNR